MRYRLWRQGTVVIDHCSADHTIKLWESDTYREHDWLEGHMAPVMALAIHGDEGL